MKFYIVVTPSHALTVLYFVLQIFSFLISYYLFIQPGQDYDDSYCIHYAAQKHGFIVSNDRFRDQKFRFRDLIENNLISFCFVGQSDFVPNPDKLTHLSTKLSFPIDVVGDSLSDSKSTLDSIYLDAVSSVGSMDLLLQLSAINTAVWRDKNKSINIENSSLSAVI